MTGRPLRVECLAELRDIDLDGVRGGLGRLLAPEIVDQPIDGNDLAEVEDEVGEEGSRLRASELEGQVSEPDVERAEQPKLEPRPVCRPCPQEVVYLGEPHMRSLEALQGSGFLTRGAPRTGRPTTSLSGR